jgi:hypothetical protein
VCANKIDDEFDRFYSKDTRYENDQVFKVKQKSKNKSYPRDDIQICPRNQHNDENSTVAGDCPEDAFEVFFKSQTNKCLRGLPKSKFTNRSMFSNRKF